MTRYDPHVNMLRGTTEAMSSILGGADLLTVLPFDHPQLNSSIFTERIARNVQIILRDEAYLERVADPSAGSYYIESLTDSLAAATWELFTSLEAEGGFREAFRKGIVQEKVESSRRIKTDRMNAGRGHLLGTNAFPNFNEFILDQLRDESREKLGDSPMKAIRPFRLAASFEDLRLETERSGKRPKVFLLKYGNPAWMTARATFAGNFFACAGYEILDHPAIDTVEDGIHAARSSGAEVVVLCSSDDAYGDLVPPVAAGLEAGVHIVVAGFPKEQLEALKQAGVNEFIHMRSPLLETLQAFNRALLS
jgi:methylmalonyl-CoA mutase